MAKFVIAGGGIGGLATALGVARRGHTVDVLERNAAFAELGAGIQLAPNAFAALEELGVAAEVRARAVHIDAIRLLDGESGRPLACLPIDDAYRDRFGGTYAVVQRGDLYAPLLRACEEDHRIQLRAGSMVTGYVNDTSSVSVLLGSGERVEADGLVGADGIRSAVRARLVGDGAPVVSGHTIFRTVLPMDSVPAELRCNSVQLWSGPKWHLVCYPIAGGDRLNLAVTRDDGARTAVSGLPVTRRDVLDRFPAMKGVPRRLLELGRDWRTWVLCDRPPVTRWSDGRVVLMGDAAHPMLQYAAQGACMALEDAVALGDLADGPAEEIGDRFTRFAALREERTAWAQKAARWMGEAVYHPAGAEAEARDAMLAALSAEDLLRVAATLHAGPGRSAVRRDRLASAAPGRR
ncbi:FAD-dependent monooxygenase [Sphaerisporangium sp. NPDC088356]|uniref:FAD-dependent monooxygenase n=1 Tax=Sphaerisporangium sp. NPDC088356 TaxID=3154871 RepID=UPI0034192146